MGEMKPERGDEFKSNRHYEPNIKSLTVQKITSVRNNHSNTKAKNTPLLRFFPKKKAIIPEITPCKPMLDAHVATSQTGQAGIQHGRQYVNGLEFKIQLSRKQPEASV